MAKQKRRIYCKFCDFFCYDADDFVSHLERHHEEMIPEDMTPWQFFYYLKTGKTHGTCIVCKGNTSWNEKTHKYNRFCDKKQCKDTYREMFKNRMIGKYGRTTLLNDPEQQKKMLANRKISGEYIWRDHVHKTLYTGSYEKSFLEFLDEVMNFDPNDVMAPSPHTYWYEYNGKKHFYIPDFFIPSLNLEIEIKDGGDNMNHHPKIQAVDKVKESLKDDVMKKNEFNYIKIVNKENEKFLEYLENAKNNAFEKKPKPIFMIEKQEDLSLEDLNKLYTEDVNIPMIDTVVFDLGSVLVEWSARKAEENSTLPSEYFEELEKEYFDMCFDPSTEQMTVPELIQCFKDRLRDELKEYAEKAINIFVCSTEILDYTVDMIKSLKEKGYKIYYLSNWGKASFALNKEKGAFKFLKYFDGGVVSYQVKIMKPEKGIYKALINKYNLDPRKCLFYDDKQENIDAANKLGFNGQLFSYKNNTQQEIFDLPDLRNSNTVTESAVFESDQKSDIDDNFKKKSSDGIRCKAIDAHDSEAEEYIKKDSYLSKIDFYKFNGEILVDLNNDKIIGRFLIGTGKDEGFIGAVRVYDEYKGYGFGDQLISDAIQKYNGIDLIVFKDNKVAIKLYKKHGFVAIGYGDKKSKDSYWMKLKSKLTKDDKVMNI